jgi:hypothetical protein
LFDRGLQCPAAGSLLSRLVQDDVDQRFTGVGVFFGKNVGGDFDQETVQVAAIPFRENVM